MGPQQNQPNRMQSNYFQGIYQSTDLFCQIDNKRGIFQDIITFALLLFIYIIILVDTKQWASLFYFYPYTLLLFASYHFLKNLICVNLYNSLR